MAKCTVCGREMRTAEGCLPGPLLYTPVFGSCGRPSTYDKVRYATERRYGANWLKPSARCGDCGVKWGQPHHAGCDIEECPRCHGQLLSCECHEHGTFR